MSARDDETLAALSGGKVRRMPNEGATYPGQSMGGEAPAAVDWHAVAARQTLSGTNTVSRTLRGSWQPTEAAEVDKPIQWDERSLNRNGIATD